MLKWLLITKVHKTLNMEKELIFSDYIWSLVSTEFNMITGLKHK